VHTDRESRPTFNPVNSSQRHENPGSAHVTSPLFGQPSNETAHDGASPSPSVDQGHGYPDSYANSRKRQRLDSCGNINIDVAQPLAALQNTASPLPPPGILQDVITAYFSLIQPWIPILHETQFRRQLHDPHQRKVLAPIVHAMVVAVLRHVDNLQDRLTQDEIDGILNAARNAVLLTALDRPSVQNLQALIIIAFNNVSNRIVYKW